MRLLAIIAALIILLIIFGGWTGFVTFPLTLWFLINVPPDTNPDQSSADTNPDQAYGPYGIMIKRSQHPRNRNRS